MPQGTREFLDSREVNSPVAVGFDALRLLGHWAGR
jgi:hypothetical protein